MNDMIRTAEIMLSSKNSLVGLLSVLDQLANNNNPAISINSQFPIYLDIHLNRIFTISCRVSKYSEYLQFV